MLQKSVRSRRKANTRNNRIRTSEHLNQHCEPTPNFESILLTRIPKIFLQQYLPSADNSHVLMCDVDGLLFRSLRLVLSASL
jgi:hypothetical protein